MLNHSPKKWMRERPDMVILHHLQTTGHDSLDSLKDRHLYRMCLSLENQYYESAPRLKLPLSAKQNMFNYMISRSKRIANLNGWVTGGGNYDFVREAAKKCIIIIAVP